LPVWSDLVAFSAGGALLIGSDQRPNDRGSGVLSVVVGVLSWALEGERFRMPQTWMLVLAPPVVIGGWDTITMGIKPGIWGIGMF